MAEQLSVDLTAEGKDSAHWYGSFRVGAQVALSIDAVCSLVLADGRRLEVQITRLAYGGPADPVKAHFRGTGKKP